ncbi:serine hydrolase domain-containing protein [Roseiterribacter gracilis]|uniref:Serine hydrolase n=1 Tax=Roseiterribacter gracilis TaxID=2812848 RepID=A0A8S8X9K8_9PROT|nr:serine hydrolase [Rhodospirillales bacterium TMPK1]
MKRRYFLQGAGALVALPAQAAQSLHQRIDAEVRSAMARDKVPGCWLSLITDGKLHYVQAYGLSSLERNIRARRDEIIPIGSITKMFIATAMLRLTEMGLVALEDPVSRHLPDLPHGDEITVRQLLTHTSGLADHWPSHNNLRPEMLRDRDPKTILAEWAAKPLTLDPGTKFGYSSTGFMAAGFIIERHMHCSLFEAMRRLIFAPLGMHSVRDVDIPPAQRPLLPEGYTSRPGGGLGTPPMEGAGWKYASGQIAMSAGDLAKFNLSLLHRTLLQPASYDDMFRRQLYKDGKEFWYGLGIQSPEPHGYKALEHVGGASGYVAIDRLYPAEQVAIAVLVNADQVTTELDLVDTIAKLVLPTR